MMMMMKTIAMVVATEETTATVYTIASANAGG